MNWHLTATVVNFVIFVFLILKFGRVHIRQFFLSYHLRTGEQIMAARKKLGESEKNLKSAQELITTSDQDATSLESSLKERANEEAAQIIKLSRMEALAIMADTRREAEHARASILRRAASDAFKAISDKARVKASAKLAEAAFAQRCAIAAAQQAGRAAAEKL